jgi:hypothetical protein
MTIEQFCVSALARQSFERLFASWMISTFTPACRLEHPDLSSALAHCGLKPPSRKAVMGKHLDAIYENTRQKVIGELKCTDFVSITMDGWKKRAAEQGAPLVTVNLLSPHGKATFWRMINARGAIKDYAWIVKQCKAVISELRTVAPDTHVIGFVMDSAAANRKAYKAMHEEGKLHFPGTDMDVLPPLILLQCASHTLSLLMKDIAKKFSWVRDVYNSAVSVSKALGNNERIFNFYVGACAADNVKPRVVASHCETRFGSQHLVLRSVVNVMPQLRKMCTSDGFEEFARSNETARMLIAIITPSTDGSFRFTCPIVEELMGPSWRTCIM